MRRGIGLGERRVGVGLNWLRAARPPLDLVERGVRRDPVKPARKRRMGLVAPQLAPCAQQGLLNDVFGVVWRAEHPVAVDRERPAVGLNELAESPLVARLRGLQESALCAG